MAEASSPNRSLWPVHALAALVVVAGVVVQIARPLAPDLGPMPNATAWFDRAYLDRAASYRQPIYAAGLVSLAVRLAVPFLVAFTARGRSLVARVVDRVGEHRPARAATAVVLLVVVGTDVLLSPLAFWAGFVHEGRFGFRTHGFGGWVSDWFAIRAPMWVMVALAVPCVVVLVRRLPRAWPPVVGLAGAGLTAVVVFASPLVLEPLLFRTEAVPQGPVRVEVERVIARSGEDIDRIVQADASRRTTKRNAYISGLGTSRQIVLYDTLVETSEPDEVGMVLAHELGHQQHADLARGTLGAAAGTIVAAYGLAWFVRRRTRRGRQSSEGDPRAAAVVLALVVALAAVSVPAQNALSRRAEAAADLAALRITGEPATYLRMNDELARGNLSDPAPPLWVRALWGTHPPSVSRLEMGRRWAEGHLE
jgi:STE24 endopeptidase